MDNVRYNDRALKINDSEFEYERITKIEVKSLENNKIEVKVETDSQTGRFIKDANNEGYNFVNNLIYNISVMGKNTKVISSLSRINIPNSVRSQPVIPQSVKPQPVKNKMMVCPTCGHNVATNAISCPSCGYVFSQNQLRVQQQQSGGLGFVGTVLAIIVAVAIIGFIG